jgi:hypothetical protein
MHDVISCPNCRHEIDLNKAVKNQLSSEVNIEYKERYKQRDDDLAIKEDKNAQDAARNKQQAIELAKQQEDFNAKVRDKENEEIELDNLIEKRAQEKVNAEISKIAKDEKEKADAIYAPEMIKATDTKNENIELRQKINALEQSQKNNDNKIDHKVAEALAIQQEKHNQENEFKEIERKEELEKVKKNLQKGLTQVNQGSNQTKGDIGEISISTNLNTLCPLDDITRTAKGANGADILQIVSSDGVNDCGKIYLEIKRTTRYEKKWLPKLKLDGREKKANVLILISETLPPEYIHPTNVDGVWHCSFNNYEHLVQLHRDYLISNSKSSQAQQNSVSGSMLTYNYVNSEDFERVVENFYANLSKTEEQVNKEKRCMNSSWSERLTTSAILARDMDTVTGTLRAYSSNSTTEIESLVTEEIEINE